jgi:hypothetical protein
LLLLASSQAQAARDATVQASKLLAEQDITLAAQRNTFIVADTRLSSTAVGSELVAGHKIEIAIGNAALLSAAQLTAPSIAFTRAPGADTTTDAQLILDGAANTLQVSRTEKGVTLPAGELKTQLASLSTQPGMDYLAQLAQRDDVNWQGVKLAHDKWDYAHDGLTPAGAMVVAAVVAYFTAGAGSAAVGTSAGAGTATTVGTTVLVTSAGVTTAAGLAINAGFTALASQAAVAMINNHGDIGKTLDQLGKEESIKNLVFTMLTAGALGSLSESLKLDQINAKSSFAANVGKNAITNLASASMDAALNGKPLNEEVLSKALSNALISAGAAQGAHAIGDAATGTLDSNGVMTPAKINAFTQSVAHALLGCAIGSASAGSGAGCSPGAVGAVVGELSAKFYNPDGKSSAVDTVNFAKTMASLVGAMSGGGTQAVSIASMTGGNAAENNYLYHYKGKIIARDKNDNDKIINLSESDLRTLAAENPQVLDQMIAGIGKTDAPLLVNDSSAKHMTSSSIQDLRTPNDRANIAKEADMGYVNINGQAKALVQTGMDNTRQNASVSAQVLSKVLGGASTGYINNGTEGINGDVGEYLPNSLSKKDVLNEYTYRTLNAQGPTLIVTHSAGNEDARKALQAGALYGRSYENLSFVSMGSPVSNSVMKQSVTGAGATYLGQVNDWRDPVTYSKMAGVGVIGTGLVGVGLLGAGLFTLNPALLYAGGAIAGGAGGAGGAAGYGLQNYHPFENYIAKPQSQSIMFDWLKKNGKP